MYVTRHSGYGPASRIIRIKQGQNILVPTLAHPHGCECALPYKTLVTCAQTEEAVDRLHSFPAPRKSLKEKHPQVSS